MTYSQARNALKLQCLHLVHHDRAAAEIGRGMKK